MNARLFSQSVTALTFALVAVCLSGCQPPGDAEGAHNAAASGAGSTPASAPRRARRVSAIVLKPERFAETIELSATLETPRDATLSAQTSGTIEMLVPLGTAVKAGDTVARIDAAMALASQRQAEATAASARAGLNLARETHRRQKPLAEKQIISALEFERINAQMAEASANLSRANAAVSQSREQVKFNHIVAPFEGIIEQHFVERGEQVSPGTPTVRLVDTHEIKLTAGVPERFSVDIGVGAALTVDFVAYGLPQREAKVTFVANTIDARNRTFNIEALLDNADGKLKPQMIAKVNLTRAVVAEALVVPRTAVLTDERGPSVFTVPGNDPAGQARRVYVKLGPGAGNAVVVTEGLTAGTRVIVRGQSELSDGDDIDVEIEGAASPAPAHPAPALPAPASPTPALPAPALPASGPGIAPASKN